MGNTPEITTERLILRRFTEKDGQAFFDLINDGEVNTYLPLFPFEAVEDACDYLRNNYVESYAKAVGFRYAICLKPNSIPVGYVNIADDDSHDLGYGLKREHWHKGIVTEASKMVIEQVKKTAIPYITATHDVNNPRSGNVMKNIGMKYCYSYEEQWQPKNKLVTFRMYQLNLDGNHERIYKTYWDKYPNPFIEDNV